MAGAEKAGKYTGLMAAAAYGVCSMTIVLFNKAVMSVYGFSYPQVLTLLQSIVTLVCMLALRQVGILKFPNLTWDIAKRVAPLSMVFLFYVVVSLASLGRVNIPMFTALRRTTIVMVMIEEYLLYGKTQNKAILATVVVMVVGAVIAASKDLTYDPISYIMLFLTNLATSLYTVSIAGVKKQGNMSAHALLFYNTVLTVPVLAILAIVTGEVEAAMNLFEFWGDANFLLCFFFSCTLAFFMNFAVYLSTSLNGPAVQTVVGQLKNFAGFILGLALFDDYVYHPVNFFGLCIGFLGGVAFSIVTMQQKKAANAAEEDKPSTASAVAAALDKESAGQHATKDADV